MKGKYKSVWRLIEKRMDAHHLHLLNATKCLKWDPLALSGGFTQCAALSCSARPRQARLCHSLLHQTQYMWRFTNCWPHPDHRTGLWATTWCYTKCPTDMKQSRKTGFRKSTDKLMTNYMSQWLVKVRITGDREQLSVPSSFFWPVGDSGHPELCPAGLETPRVWASVSAGFWDSGTGPSYGSLYRSAQCKESVSVGALPSAGC